LAGRNSPARSSIFCCWLRQVGNSRSNSSTRSPCRGQRQQQQQHVAYACSCAKCTATQFLHALTLRALHRPVQ
jgi:hypothetical protein